MSEKKYDKSKSDLLKMLDCMKKHKDCGKKKN